MRGFRDAVVARAVGGRDTAAPGLDGSTAVRTAVLVEGLSDAAAVEALAARRGRDLEAEGVCVVPMGGATNIGRFVKLLGPHGLDVRVAGLCDDAEERFYRRSLERAGLGPGPGRAGMEALGFFVCVADLEDELIRALGVERIEEIVGEQGDLRPLRTFQRQPVQRTWSPERQLRRFMGTTAGRKIHYAGVLAAALSPAQVPRPLDGLLTHLT